MNQGRLFVISAPSGAGKTTILRPILEELSGINFSVSHTTRAPRQGEKNGVDYYFVNTDEFLELKKKGDFLEWAEVHGNYYGTSKSAVTDELNQGLDIILDIDIQGASQLMSSADISATYIFIAPPSLEVLKQRLSGRNTETPENLEIRLNNAVKELQTASKYDYIIINDVLDNAILTMKSIIFEKRTASGRAIDGSPLPLDAIVNAC